MPKKQQDSKQTEQLSRREREIMAIVYRLGQATVGEVLEAMDDPPSYSAVRSTLNILENKGHLAHRHRGNRYVYLPTVDRTAARRSALEQLVTTFFDGSAADAATALLEVRGEKLTRTQLDQLARLIRDSRRDGR